MPSRPVVRFARTPHSLLALVLVLGVAFAAITGCAAKNNGPSSGGTPKVLDSGNIAAGNSFSHTFATGGTFHYHCSIHASMVGTVTVDASAPDTTADVDITTIAPFAAASVKPGGTVRWHNNSAMTHTVTSD